MIKILETDHIVLRAWTDEDFEPFAPLNADPEVMKYFSEDLDRDQSDELAEIFSFTSATNSRSESVGRLSAWLIAPEQR